MTEVSTTFAMTEQWGAARTTIPQLSVADGELNWQLPDKDLTFNQTVVKRASSKYGTYSTLTTTTSIRTVKYLDKTAVSSSWYKIQFYDTANAIYSAESVPIPNTSTVSDTNYTTPKEVASYLNRFRTITGESLGTGNGTTTSFTAADPKIIADTETVYVAGVTKQRNVDYSVEYDSGVITFATAPASGAITADYWADSTVVNSRVIASIRRAEDEINRKTGRTFYQPQTVTEFIDSYDVVATDIHAYSALSFDENVREYTPSTNAALISRVIQLANYPVTSISQLIINAQPTSVSAEAVGTGAGVVTVFPLDYSPVVYGSEVVYVAGVQTTSYTIDYSTGIITFTGTPPTGAITCDYQHCTQGTVIAAADYLLRGESGIIILKDTVSSLKRNPFIATAVYAYGYSEPPAVVQDLATRIAARVVFQSTLMGSPNPMEFTSSNLAVMLRDIDALYDTIGRKMVLTRL